MCVRCKGEEGISRPPFIEGVVVLYGPPAEKLKTGVDFQIRIGFAFQSAAQWTLFLHSYFCNSYIFSGYT